MPKATYIAPSAAYLALTNFDGKATLGEDTTKKADCAVIALAIAASISYSEAYALLAANGRAPSSATSNETIKAALESLGYTITQFDNPSRISDDFPGVHSNLKNVTTHTPRRFKSAWDKHFAADANLLLFSKEHVSAYNEGILKDWAVNASRRVNAIWILTKAEATAAPEETTEPAELIPAIAATTEKKKARR